MAKALTVRGIEALQPGVARREIPDGLVPGLYHNIQPSGARSWAVRYRVAGRPAKLTIGPYPAIDLASARDLARRALVDVAKGNDPGAAKKESRQAAKQDVARDQLDVIVKTFLARHARPNTRASSAKEYARVLNKELVTRWPGRRLSELGRADIHELLDSVIDRGSPVQANRVLAAVRKLCSWALDRGLIEKSPCAGIKPPTAETSRDRVLADDELRAIWHAAVAVGYPSGTMAQLLMLTGQRRSEVAAITWDELDMKARTWTIPAGRAKNGREHVVPLGPQALAILEAVPRIGDRYIFTTSGRAAISGYGKFKATLDRTIAKQAGSTLADWTYHDLRRTAATGMARLGTSIPVIERTLNHTSGAFRGIVAVYQRHDFLDERRHALATWGSFIERLVTAKPGANVVALAARAS